MNYKGYVAKLDIVDEAGVIRGEILGISETLTFEGLTVPEVRTAFEAVVDQYISSTQNPEVPYSGEISLRLDPSIHRSAALNAARDGVELNAWVVSCITDKLGLDGKDAQMGSWINFDLRTAQH